jgi:hypothetical protein
LHGRAASIASDADARDILFERISYLLGRDGDLQHPDLVAVIIVGVPRSVSSSMAASRACARPMRLAIRGRSWLPSTQLGQPRGGRAAS